MQAIEFNGFNAEIGKGQSQYAVLPAFIDMNDKRNPTTVCFELSDRERQQVAETGRIWITVLTFGRPLNPISMSCLKPENL